MNQFSAPRRPGCFGYGCLIATVLFCLAIGIAWFVGLRSLREAVEQYTSAAIEPLAQIRVDQELASQATSKWAELNSAAIAGTALVHDFSTDELQGLLQGSHWRDWVRVGLSGDEAKIQFSLPLASLGEWVAASRLVGSIKDRGLVGSARIRIAPKDATHTSATNKAAPFQINFQELVLNQQVLEDLPRGYAADWVTGALTSAISDRELSSSFAPVFRALERLELRDGRLVVAVGASLWTKPD